MRKVQIILGKTQRRILKVLLEGILDKAEMKDMDVYFFVKVRNGEPNGYASLVEKE